MRGKCTLTLVFVISAVLCFEEDEQKNDHKRVTRITRLECAKDTFICKNQKYSQCIPLISLCNGIRDCQDGSDESAQYCKIINTGSCVDQANETESCQEQIPPYTVPLEADESAPETKTYSYFCSWVPFPKYGTNIPLICKNGVWVPVDMSRCNRVCQKISISAVRIECYRHGKKIDCKTPLLSDTKVRSYCPPEYRPNYKEVTCGADGEWNHNIIECIPECGKPYRNNSTKYVGKMRPADHREFPWNVAVFGKVYLLCPATIITPYMVLTVATCVFQLTGKELEVVVAKRTNNRDQIDDDLQHSYKVKRIHLTEKEWDGHDLRFADNIAILELADRIRINAAAYPACLNWGRDEKLMPEDNVEGLVSSWQVKLDQRNFGTNENLQTAPMKFYSRPTCLNIIPSEDVKFVRIDSFCIENSLPPTPLQGGSSWIFRDRGTNLNFLHGMMSNGDSYNITVFTDATYHVDWINKVRKVVEKRLSLTDIIIDTKLRETDIVCKSSPLETTTVTKSLNLNTDEAESDGEADVDGCLLPERTTLRADFKVGCPLSENEETTCQKANESELVPLYTTLTLTCEAGYTTDSETEVVCLKNKWRPSPAPCIRTCKSLSPINMHIKCYQQDEIDCNGVLKVGTSVTPNCFAEYTPEVVPDYRNLVCQDDGEWSASLFRCVPKCGVPAAQNLTALIHGGRKAKFGEFPWQVGIYDITQKNENLICSGTIVSPYIVVSAAHCFYTDQTNQKRSPENYVIAVAKITRDYDVTDSELTKFYELENILFTKYEGKKLRYRNDIALLITRVKIAFNPFVIPACMSQNNRIIESSKRGRLQVSGWGKDEKGHLSPELKTAELPVIADSDCVRKAPVSLVDFFTEDKFCGGDANGTAVDTGDSGGGLLFQDPTSSLYYLIGIVSIKSASRSSIALFTDVHHHHEWITQNINEIQKRKKDVIM